MPHYIKIKNKTVIIGFKLKVKTKKSILRIYIKRKVVKLQYQKSKIKNKLNCRHLSQIIKLIKTICNKFNNKYKNKSRIIILERQKIRPPIEDYLKLKPLLISQNIVH